MKKDYESPRSQRLGFSGFHSFLLDLVLLFPMVYHTITVTVSDVVLSRSQVFILALTLVLFSMKYFIKISRNPLSL